jgi:competence protein ComEC
MTVLSFCVAVINQTLSEPHAGLLSGILFGTKATLLSDFKNALITTGTLHIVALSGMNISILTALVNDTLLRCIKRPIANIVSIALIIGFIWLVGPSPSIIRAAIMGFLTLLAINMGRQIWPQLSWILAVSTMLLLNPLWIGDVSFQLSALATLGIILFGRKSDSNSECAARIFPSDVLANSPIGLNTSSDHTSYAQQLSSSGWQLLRALDGSLYSRVTRGFMLFFSFIYDDLRITLAAQVFTIPLLLFQFHRISLVAPLTNILMGWLIAPITVIGFAQVIGGLVWLPLGQAIGWVSWVLLTFVIEAIKLTAKLPFASISF